MKRANLNHLFLAPGLILALSACSQINGPTSNPDASLQPLSVPTLTWFTETVDPDAASSGLFTSLALDSHDRPHISYQADGVKYAHFDGNTWHTESIHLLGLSSSIAVDDSDGVHVVYTKLDFPIYSVYYAYNDGTGWARFEITSSDTVLSNPSLALDGDGHPHVSYHAAGALTHAYNHGTAWVIDEVPGATWTFGGSIAIDSSDHPHISYREHDATSTFNGFLRYAHHDGTTWSIEQLDNLGPVDMDTALALDSGDHPHIAYKSFDDFKYAHYNGTTWAYEVIDDGGTGNLYPSIAINASDEPLVSYDLGLDLKFAHRSAGIWEVETVDTGIAARHTSLALDSNNLPHISYAAESDADLKYAISSPDADGDGIPNDADPDTVGTAVEALPDSVFAPTQSATGHRNSILSILQDIEQDIANGDTEEAIRQLRNLRRHVDGCPATPTSGEAADANDWIVDCDAQRDVRDLIDRLITNLSS